METSEKTRIYQQLYRKAEAFCEVENDLVANKLQYNRITRSFDRARNGSRFAGRFK